MTVTAQFQDRSEAGQLLAAKLGHHAGDPSLLILALPRGGVPVAYEIAKSLKAPLDVFLVRRIAVPDNDELTLGIIASGGVTILDRDVAHRLNLSPAQIEEIARTRRQELEQRETVYRGQLGALQVADRNVILVDDGLATGVEMCAAIKSLKARRPGSIIVAAPIGSANTCKQIQGEVDEVICGMTPDPFFTVGAWYSDFMQVTDSEINELLNRAAQERHIDQVRQRQAR